MNTIQVFLWLNVIFIATSHHILDTNDKLQVEERVKSKSGSTYKTGSKLNEMIHDERTKEGIGEALANLGGYWKVATLDYNRPAKEVIKDVGNALLPTITAGLSLIPGGHIVAGVVNGLWGIISPFLGSRGPSPMQKMIDGIKNDIKIIKKELVAIRKQITESAKKTVEQIRREIQTNLSSITNMALNAEIRRNQYICNKYALVAKDYVEELRNNRTISEVIRLELIGHIHNCDNFLKDTAEAFFYPDYADILWIPSVMTTMVRLGFLAEFINYGHSLKIDKAILGMFWAELKEDIKRHFAFSGEGSKKRLESLYENYRNYESRSFTDAEYEGCRLQGQLIYFDREMYPYGVPKLFRIFNDNTDLKLADYNVSNSDEPQHIQVFYNEFEKRRTENIETIFNCITGTSVYSRMPTSEMSFRVTYVFNKSYQIRVLYFTKEYKNGFAKTRPSEFNPQAARVDDSGPVGSRTSNRRLTISAENDNTIVLSIGPGEPDENSAQRFLLKTNYHEIRCYDIDIEISDEDILQEAKCESNLVVYSGNLVLEYVAGFNVLPDQESKGKIVVKNPSKNDVVIFGVELMIRPLNS